MSKRGGVSASYCCARNCQNRRDTSNLFYFKLPTDRERAKIWLSACDREDLIKHLGNLDGLKICSAHFEDHMFETMIKDRLVMNAVPTILQQGGPIMDVQMTESENQGIDAMNVSETAISPAATAPSFSSQVGNLKSTENPVLLAELKIKDEKRSSTDIPMIPAPESSVETPSAITPLNETTQSEQNLDISSLIEQKVTDVGVERYSEEHLKSSKLLTEFNIKSEEVDESIDDEFKELSHEVTKVSDAHIDMFFESLLGVAKTLNRGNQIILTDKLKEIVNEYR